MKKLKIFIIFLIILILLIPIFLSNNVFYFNEVKNIEKQKEINMIFFGDIMLGRNIETLSKDNNNYPFLKIDKNLTSNKDIVYANLEGPIMEPHYKTKNGSTVFSFPEYSINVLKDNKFNLLSLANNHMQDYGFNGYNQTQNFLKNNNINYLGDYYNKDNLYIKKNIKGKEFVFFGINMINKNFEKNLDENKKYVLEEITKIKKENPNSFVILFIHWGNEYKIKSNTIQQTFAHKLIDDGVDLIIGSHPHVVEEYEIYKNKYVFYSLGNFVFDQYFSTETQEMISVKLNITCNEEKDCKNNFEIIPIKSINSQPEIIIDEKEKKAFLNKYNLNIN